MNGLLIGREKEQKDLKQCVESQDSEFVAVYGRRRVGKTYLVRKFFDNGFAFFLTGIDNVTMQEQLTNFAITLGNYTNTEVPVPQNWLYAFNALQKYLESLPDGNKVIFIDEMPWLDTPKSRFISALEHFWNSWASGRSDIKLIACGSATSWMTDNLINNRGGLHNRVTRRILLQPFTLSECRRFFEAKNFAYSNHEIAECYMVTGGVPFYLKLLSRELSVAQNVDALFFETDAQLADEYQNLMRSLFKHSANYIRIIEALATKGIGLSRLDIIKHTGLSNNGGLTQMLSELQSCGFIREYLPLSKLKKTSLYQIIDPFLLFYFRFIRVNKYHNEHFWTASIASPLHDSWTGYAFEIMCLNHINQIKSALGISGVDTRVASWRSEQPGNGAQIDLVIDRADNVVNICEMKYSKKEYSITAKYENELLNKITAFRSETQTSKSVRLTMVTSRGIVKNAHSTLVQNELTLNDLFL